MTDTTSWDPTSILFILKDKILINRMVIIGTPLPSEEIGFTKLLKTPRHQFYGDFPEESYLRNSFETLQRSNFCTHASLYGIWWINIILLQTQSIVHMAI